MPGKDSLRTNQYYGHPRNLFWPLMENVLELQPSLSYEDRKAAFLASGIGMWDVLKSCARTTSLDRDIDEDSIEANDFISLFEAQPLIQTVCFNGKKAAQIFEQHVAPTLPAEITVAYRSLPSTSPANARTSFKEKLEQWRVVGTAA